VIAPADQVPDSILDTMRGAGALLVERVVGENGETTKTMLNEMARRGQRFLTAIAPVPPQEEPPAEPPPPPPVDGHETYTIQPAIP